MELEGLSAFVAGEMRWVAIGGPPAATKADGTVGPGAVEDGDYVVSGVESSQQVCLVLSVADGEDLRDDAAAATFPVTGQGVFGGRHERNRVLGRLRLGAESCAGERAQQ